MMPNSKMFYFISAAIIRQLFKSASNVNDENTEVTDYVAQTIL
jgi:hypothetical protein